MSLCIYTHKRYKSVFTLTSQPYPRDDHNPQNDKYDAEHYIKLPCALSAEKAYKQACSAVIEKPVVVIVAAYDTEQPRKYSDHRCIHSLRNSSRFHRAPLAELHGSFLISCREGCRRCRMTSSSSSSARTALTAG